MRDQFLQEKDCAYEDNLRIKIGHGWINLFAQNLIQLKTVDHRES